MTPRPLSLNGAFLLSLLCARHVCFSFPFLLLVYIFRNVDLYIYIIVF